MCIPGDSYRCLNLVFVARARHEQSARIGHHFMQGSIAYITVLRRRHLVSESSAAVLLAFVPSRVPLPRSLDAKHAAGMTHSHGRCASLHNSSPTGTVQEGGTCRIGRRRACELGGRISANQRLAFRERARSGDPDNAQRSCGRDLAELPACFELFSSANDHFCLWNCYRSPEDNVKKGAEVRYQRGSGRNQRSENFSTDGGYYGDATHRT